MDNLDKKIAEMLQKKEAEQDKIIKGYAYDSLCLRYKDARYKQMELERMKDLKCGIDKTYTHYRDMAHRDFMRFCQILNEVIGEHY